jgi:hypothetical protein
MVYSLHRFTIYMYSSDLGHNHLPCLQGPAVLSSLVLLLSPKDRSGLRLLRRGRVNAALSLRL